MGYVDIYLRIYKFKHVMYIISLAEGVNFDFLIRVLLNIATIIGTEFR